MNRDRWIDSRYTIFIIKCVSLMYRKKIFQVFFILHLIFNVFNCRLLFLSFTSTKTKLRFCLHKHNIITSYQNYINHLCSYSNRNNQILQRHASITTHLTLFLCVCILQINNKKKLQTSSSSISSSSSSLSSTSWYSSTGKLYISP